MSLLVLVLSRSRAYFNPVRFCVASALVLLLSPTTLALGQAAPNPAASTDSCPDLKPGVVVESVAKNSEGEKAGITEGDVILAWIRADAKDEIRSPFDLSEVETEQEPRGQVTLEGTRDTANRPWTMGPDKWGLTTRPNLPDPLLAIYRDSWQLTKAGNFEKGKEGWRGAASKGQKYQCAWLVPWLLSHAAEMLSDVRQWNASDTLYQEAVKQAESTKPQIKAQLLRSWSTAFQQRGDWATAGIYEKQALAESQKLNTESVAAARSLNNLGNVAYYRGDLATADDYYRKSLDIRERLAPGSLDVAATLNNLGNVTGDRGDLTKADEYYRQSLAIRGKLAPDSVLVATSLMNLGNDAYERGDLAEAEHYHLQSMEIKKILAPGSLDVAFSLNNLGRVARRRGDLSKAEEYFQQSLAIEEKLTPGSLHGAFNLNQLGNVAYNRGDLAKAEEYYRQSLVIREKLAPGSRGLSDSLENIGNVAAERGDLAKSEEYYRQSLAIREKLAPGSLPVAGILENLGNRAKDRGDFAKAEEYGREALAIDEKLAPDSLDVAQCLNNLGEVMSKRHDLAKSEEFFRQALEIRKKLAPDSTDYADSLAELAENLRDQKSPDEAAKLYAEAVDVLDRQLSHLGGSSEARSGFRAQHASYYSEYADLLVADKKSELAFDVIERARARTLLETLAESHVDIRKGADPSVIAKERLLQATLTAKTNRKIDLLEENHTAEQLSGVNEEIAEILTQYQELEGQIRSSSPKYAGLTQPKPLDAHEVQQQLLDGDTVLLEYALGTEHSFVFVVTPTSMESIELPKRAEIEASARHVYDLLTSRNRWVEGETSVQRKARLNKDEAEYQKTAFALSQMVLGPVAQRLERKRLLIVADGALQYIPFSVLPTPTSNVSQPAVPLVAEHEIVNLPSASVLALLRQQAKERDRQPTKEVAILADPVFDKNDPRVGRPKEMALVAATNVASGPVPSSAEHLTRSLEDVSGSRQAGAGLSRLVFSRREAAAIAAVAKPHEGMEALDFEASRETAMSKDLGQYRIVHFATHGLLDNEHPELSGLVLSMVGPDGKPQNGFLDLEDIYNLTLPADLVVLSACETGLGKEINGEGLVGLTRGFMYAGATRVVASLWKVDDAATAELMGAFYKAMLVGGLRPAAALRQAQLELMKQKRWHDPYYWAAFTLQGEWK